MSVGLWVTLAGLAIASMSALLGVWVERDPHRPPRYAYALSLLIILSMLVGLGQAWLKNQAGAQMEADLARILDDLDQLASDDPAVDAYVSEEVRAQVRTHPGVVNALAERASARGETIESILQ